jgi:uncharacterized protein
MRTPVYFIPASGKEGPGELAEKARLAYMAIGLDETIAEDDFVALKIHFGEKNNTGYIRPQWLGGIVSQIGKRSPRAFLTDSNTLYLGKRSNSVDHIRLAWAHGFTPQALDIPVIIADGLIGRDVRETGGGHGRIKAAKIAGAFLSSDVLLGLTHFTGHVQTGIGGSIKNMGMGCASRAGKLDQHSVVHLRVNPKQCRNCSVCLDLCPENAIVQAEGHVVINGEKCVGCGECLVVCKRGAIKMRWDEDSVRIQEKLAEYALTVQSHFKGRIGFLNFLIKITKDCDCMAGDQPRIVEDIGILASRDVVAVDRAGADMVIERAGGDVFRRGHDIDWSVQFRHGERIGLGRTDYELVRIA